MNKLIRRNGSIQRQLVNSFTLVVFIVGVFSIMMFYTQKRLADEYKNIYIENVRLSELNIKIDGLVKLLEKYLVAKETDMLMKIHSNLSEIGEFAVTYKSTPITEETDLLRVDIGNMLESMRKIADNAIMSKIGNKVSQYTTHYEVMMQNARFIKQHTETLNNILLKQNSECLIEFMEKQSFLHIVMIIMYILVAGTCLLLLYSRTNRIIKPFTEMACAAQEISNGNLDVEDVSVLSNDEISILAKAFNQMKRDIKTSLEQMEQKNMLELSLKEEQMNRIKIQNALKEAQYMALQAQIKPHFLFNTINAGVQIAFMEGAEKTVAFMQAMSSLFRYNLRNINEPVSLSQELENIDMYLYILRQRIGDAIEYVCDILVPKEVLINTKMPCMILQPLVENCYIHGIREKGSGIVTITVFENAENIVVSVKDDGVGMTEEEIRWILSGSKEPTSRNRKSTGIGLDNVINRLILFLGDRKVIDIFSKKNQGTEVMIYLSK
jgi:two-component system sensor histidine kinase YesM